MYGKSILNDIRERISIVSLVGERVALKRAGRNFKGVCPFHNEKTPSFNVSDEKGIYHCFGCGEGGDVFQFLIKFDGMTFAEAVKHLAARAGIELPQDFSPQEKEKEEAATRKKRMCFRVNEIAREYFVSRLLNDKVGASARRYLQLRGIKEEFFTQLFLGFADNSWDAFFFHLKEKGVPLELACELGLLKKRDGGGYYDFFRNRLMFWVVSPRDEVLGFSGRDLGEGKDESVAKYLNSPDSIIYHKSNSVFGLDRAMGQIRNEDMVLLVEGNMDLVSLHQAGITNVVAPLGTALTGGQLRLLKRYTKNFVVIFDGDNAGKKAAVRSLEAFIEEGLVPRVVILPEGEDPDSIVKKEGAEIFKKRIANAVPLFEFFVSYTFEACGQDASGKVAALKIIVPVLKTVTDPAERGLYRRLVARRLDVDENSIEQALKGSSVKTQGAMPVKAQKNEKVAATGVERTIIEIMLIRPDFRGKVFEELSPADFENEWSRRVVDILYESFKEDEHVKIGDVIETIEDESLAAQLRQLSMTDGKFEDNEVQELLADCLASIKRRPSIARMTTVNEEIKRLEAEGNDAELLKLLAEKGKLAAQIKGGS